MKNLSIEDNTIEEIKRQLEEQKRNILEVIKQDRFDGDVLEYIESVIFSENDIIENYLKDHKYINVSIEELRELQHDLIQSIIDIIRKWCRLKQ